MSGRGRSLGATMVILGAHLPGKLNLQEFEIFPDCYSVSTAESIWFRSVFGDKGPFPGFPFSLLPGLQAPVWGDALQTARDSIREKLQAGTLARAGKEQL